MKKGFCRLSQEWISKYTFNKWYTITEVIWISMPILLKPYIRLVFIASEYTLRSYVPKF